MHDFWVLSRRFSRSGGSNGGVDLRMAPIDCIFEVGSRAFGIEPKLLGLGWLAGYRDVQTT
jgi:hypothetical protein